jgi:nitrite reductase (NADH) large subunit
VIGDEPRPAYNRVLVSSVLAGETAPEAIELKPMSWWRDSPLSSTGSGIARIFCRRSAPRIDEVIE